jgi:hypothetical protein
MCYRSPKQQGVNGGRPKHMATCVAAKVLSLLPKQILFMLRLSKQGFLRKEYEPNKFVLFVLSKTIRL